MNILQVIAHLVDVWLSGTQLHANTYHQSGAWKIWAVLGYLAVGLTYEQVHTRSTH